MQRVNDGGKKESKINYEESFDSSLENEVNFSTVLYNTVHYLISSHHLTLNALPRDHPFKRDLQDAQYVRDMRLTASATRGRGGSRCGLWALGAHKHIQAMGGGVREHLQVVRRVLVVCRGVQSPNTLQKQFRQAFVAAIQK